MLLNTSIRQEMGRNFGAIAFVLLTIVMTIVMIRSLRFVTFGIVSPADTILFMFFTVIGYSPSILALCIFIAVVSCFSRLYQDSEMTVWRASGQGLLQFLHPVLWFGLPIVIGIAVLAFFVQPWADRQVLNLRVQYETNQFRLLSPGRFQESHDGKRVVFIDKDQDNTAQIPGVGSEVHNIFMVLRSPEKDILVFAPRARIANKSAQLYAILSNGQQLELFHNDQQLRIADYDSYGVWLQESALLYTDSEENPGRWPARAQPTQTLWSGATPEQVAELYWRVGLPALGMVALFLALAVTNRYPRAGKSLNLAYALLLLVIYYNLMVIGQNYVRKGLLTLWLGLVMVHGSFLLFSVSLLFKRHFQYSVRQRLGL